MTPEIRKARYKGFEAFDSFSPMVVRREARISLHSNPVPSQIPFPATDLIPPPPPATGRLRS